MQPLRIGISLGDPAGIGPEVTERALHAWLDAADRKSAVQWTVFGPTGIADALAKSLGPSVNAACGPAFLGPMAQASSAGGHAALWALNTAIARAQDGKLDALVTAPINKAALHLAGSLDLGHTEILRRGLGAGPVGMAFFTPKLQVILATAHMPLQALFAALTPQRVLEVTRLLHAGLGAYKGIAKPRLAMAGLNPHAGEGGLMGDEEARVLAPAIAQARAEGILISEPQPPDTVFRRAVDGEFDGVVALYHDQGLIAVKLVAFGEAVNVTLGLQVPRTSPDHGTAFDCVGLGTARSDGMRAALETAVSMASHGRFGALKTTT